MHVRVGTSGYSYKEWKGKFYPEDLPANAMLRYYAERLNTVEINNTFYRMPTDRLVEGWALEVPGGFTFAVKAPQRITHQKRLKEAGEVTATFVRTVGALGDKLGPLIFQLPPFMKKDVARLNEFLSLLPSGLKTTFEFRHESWFTDDVFETLRTHRAALCAAESDELASPVVATTDWGYMRLRRTDYSDRELDEWANKIRSQNWTDAFVYMKHDEGAAPELAARLLARVGRD
jgi:uncharacterized protein YecE (DUF72 family)